MKNSIEAIVIRSPQDFLVDSFAFEMNLSASLRAFGLNDWSPLTIQGQVQGTADLTVNLCPFQQCHSLKNFLVMTSPFFSPLSFNLTFIFKEEIT